MSNLNAIQLSGVSKSFDGFMALSQADFTARWGEVHALLGENGAGKSSLMNIAAGLYAPESGSLLINDNAVRLSGPRDASRYHIGMVHQHFKLVKPFTVAENIQLALPEGPGNHASRAAIASAWRLWSSGSATRRPSWVSASTRARSPSRFRWPSSSGWRFSRCCWPARAS